MMLAWKRLDLEANDTISFRKKVIHISSMRKAEESNITKKVYNKKKLLSTDAQ